MQLALSKNAVEFALQANVAYCMPFLTDVTKRRNWTASKSEDFYGCRILRKVFIGDMINSSAGILPHCL
ncbi:hypothetical protein [Treponema putidum]|uniref:hypothetical protein n=1 Tax=Treponema putidum TaxID=221027 RepID=UPI002106C72B|nr:hypothetical protein [Treponema putidum]UTY31116.1 hypothetical protein E4N75_05960 [Treponema putidum]